MIRRPEARYSSLRGAAVGRAIDGRKANVERTRQPTASGRDEIVHKSARGSIVPLHSGSVLSRDVQVVIWSPGDPDCVAQTDAISRVDELSEKPACCRMIAVHEETVRDVQISVGTEGHRRRRDQSSRVRGKQQAQRL